MFKRVSILLILFLILIFNNSAIAENRILFVDIDYIYSNSVAGKEINNSIKKKTNDIKSELNNYQKDIEEDKKNLLNKQNVLAKVEFEKRYSELENLIKELNIKMNKKNNSLIKYKNKVEIEFKKELDLILREYATNNSIDMILNKKNILIGKNNLNATNEILEIFDKKIKKISLD